MSFRITQGNMSRTTLSNINLNLKKMQEIQEKLSTGKQINRPSDNPSGMRKVLGLKAEELKFQQFSDNTEIAKERMNYTFNSLENIQDVLSKIKELGIQASNDTIGQSEREIIAGELNELLESVLQFTNAENDGRYIFAGTKTTTSPFSATRDSAGRMSSVTYEGNNEEIDYQIGPNTYIAINTPGETIFQGNGLFSTLISMRDALESNAFDSSAFLDSRKNLDVAMDALATEITRYGAKTNRLELTSQSLENLQITLKELISYTEDADVATLIMNLKEQENILQSSLETGARIIQPTLLDFLR
ncbi:flagellar hook-associated protein 3 [Candidatus Brocadia pituitae]|nr:flagellar hook-associated protein 3 [Candidatus Brocadia pituitae]